MPNNEVIDPWGTVEIKDYRRLYDLFGIEPIENIIDQIPNPSRFMRRRIEFGHRDFQLILKAIKENREYAVMSGIKPTGEFHIGSKMTADEIIYLQNLSPKARVFYCVADIEAYEDNGIPLKESASTAISNVADMLALGLDTKRAYVYKQSDEKHVQRLAYLFARHVTYATMKAIYGEKSFGHYFSALIQVGDILLPQLPEFGGPKPTVVPIGADQDPHIRLTRDLAQKFQSEYGFILPGALYHKLARSLSGDIKMSKREPMSLLTLSDDPELAKKKITLAFTGGRETVAKQRELGGEPENCVVYELFVFHFVENDREVKRIYDECKSGRRLCGECKNLLADIVAKFLYEHQKKKAKLISNAEEILTSKGG